MNGGGMQSREGLDLSELIEGSKGEVTWARPFMVSSDLPGGESLYIQFQDEVQKQEENRYGFMVVVKFILHFRAF